MGGNPDTRRGETAVRAFAAVRGAVYAALFVWLWAWLALLVRRYDAALPVGVTPALRPAGLVLAALGGLLVLSCVVTFAAAGHGTPAPFDAPRRFVAAGPYRFVRNPMYLGAAGVLAGSALAAGSPAILLLAAAFLLLAHAFVLLHEEPALRRRFGEPYAAYTREVGRWLPPPPVLWLVAGILLAATLLATLVIPAPAGTLDDSF